jgi:hypothetical protein
VSDPREEKEGGVVGVVQLCVGYSLVALGGVTSHWSLLNSPPRSGGAVVTKKEHKCCKVVNKWK